MINCPLHTGSWSAITWYRLVNKAWIQNQRLKCEWFNITLSSIYPQNQWFKPLDHNLRESHVYVYIYLKQLFKSTFHFSHCLKVLSELWPWWHIRDWIFLLSLKQIRVGQNIWSNVFQTLDNSQHRTAIPRRREIER